MKKILITLILLSIAMYCDNKSFNNYKPIEIKLIIEK